MLGKARDYKSKARKRAAYWVRGTRVHGIYKKGIFRGRVVEDLKTKVGWHVGTAAAFCGLYAAATNKQVKQMAGELKSKKEELINKQKTIEQQQNTINQSSSKTQSISSQDNKMRHSNQRRSVKLAWPRPLK